jgi:alpha-galactosidase
VVLGSTRAALPFLSLRLRGLDPDLNYRIDGDEALYSGDVLMQAGYPLPLREGDYQSIQLYLTAEA